MTQPKKYTKKPVTIEAFRWDGEIKPGHPITRWIRNGGGEYHWTPAPQTLAIVTLEGLMKASPGDFIIKGVQGEFYPCKPDIFEATYSPVTTSKDN